jgi:hypothetical protein
MQDDRANENRIEACYRALVDDPKFRYRNFAARLLGDINDATVSKGNQPMDCNALAVQLTGEPALREAFTGAVLRAHQHHIDDLKEIRFVPNFFHTVFVLLGRQMLSLARRIRG